MAQKLDEEQLVISNIVKIANDLHRQLLTLQEQVNDFVQNKSSTSPDYCLWQDDFMLRKDLNSEALCLMDEPVSTLKITTDMYKIVERNKRKENNAISLESIEEGSHEEEGAEDYPHLTTNDTEDEDANATTDTHPPGLEALTKTETLTKPINESEVRSEIRSMIDEQCGALTWRACYFDMQINGKTKALNTTPFHANRGSHADDTSTGQGDGIDDNVPILSTDIIDRLRGILGK